MEASQNHERCTTDCPAIDPSILKEAAGMDGPVVTDIAIGAFSYGVADLGTIAASGIPRVVKNTPVTFWNLDTAIYAWHTITRCSYPCTGATSASYPVPDAGTPMPGGDPMDFDSAELGIGLAPANRVEWEFTPTETGVFTFFCRIHPGMRGAFEVVDSA
jgi:plastocyanin